jgi:metal-responsive CopG/Arc/MetJ family transcriptional regulator
MSLKRVLLTVPDKLLKHFDREIKGAYTSRNEAIRASMKLLLEELEKT